MRLQGKSKRIHELESKLLKEELLNKVEVDILRIATDSLETRLKLANQEIYSLSCNLTVARGPSKK